MPPLAELIDRQGLQAISITAGQLGFYLIYTIVTALVMRAVPRAFRKPLLLVASLLFGELFLDPLIAGFVLGFSVALFLVTRMVPAGWKRTTAATVLLLAVFLPFCFSGVPLARARSTPGYYIGNLVFLIVYLKRAVYYLYELHYGRVRRPSALDFGVAFLSLPFLLGRAPIYAFGHMQQSFGPVGWKGAWSGIKAVLLASLHLLTLGVLATRFMDVPMDAHLAQAARSLPTWELALILGLNYVAFYLFRYGHDQMSVGAARLLGFAVDDNYANPLAATDYADFWRRWNIHFRNMLVSMFYYPAVLWLSRRYPGRKSLNVILACVSVFSAHYVFMAFTMGMFIPTDRPERWVNMLVALGIYELLQITLTAGSLLLLGRAHRTGRWRWIGIPLGIGVTFTLRSLMLLLIWSRSMDLDGAWVVLLALLT